MSYSRISRDVRLKIEGLYKIGIPVSLIASSLGYSRKSIYLELKKGFYENYGQILYSADIAQQKTDFLSSSRGCPLKIGKNHAASKLIEDLILDGYSPYAAAQLLKARCSLSLSKGTIYRYIDMGLFMRITNKDLTFGKRRPARSPVIRLHKSCYGRSIDVRPSAINTRDDFGHWEADTVLSRAGGRRQCLLVLTERQTRYELILRLGSRTSAEVVRAVNRLFRTYGSLRFRKIFKTITCDNGGEFADVSSMERAGRTSIYFCHPYSAFERGSNEKQNQLIRRKIPKGTLIESLSDSYIASVQLWLNSYPRLLFGGVSSAELYSAAVSCL